MTSSAARPERARIAVFAKAPVAGAVKTRLAASIGAQAAAALHAGFVRRALAMAVESQAGPVDLWCTPDEGGDFFAGCAREFGVALRRQQGGDLGARMGHAMEATLATGASLVLIGSDCPAMTAEHLRRAREALFDNDAVLTPAEDGGYVLVGQSVRLASIFTDIPWSTGAVMERTRERLVRDGAKWVELETLWDVDRPEDYERWLHGAACAQPP
jgi:rSAM/selenodomain-associated transferase 1